MSATPHRRGCQIRRLRTDLISLGFLALLAGPTHASLLVSSAHTGSVLRFNGSTGAFIEPFVPMGNGASSSVSGLAFGPEGNLYVGCPDIGTVMRYDFGWGDNNGGNNNGGNNNGGNHNGQDFQREIFASGGGLNPSSLAIGPDGHLYVSSQSTNDVRRYEGHSGFFLGPFAFGGGLTAPTGLAFGPDGNLYVASNSASTVVRFSGQTGLPLDTFITPGSGGLDHPMGLIFGPDGNWYVASQNTNSVIRYNGTTGVPVGTFASGGGLTAPTGLAFGPDGNLYVCSSGTDSVLRFNGSTGAFIDTFIPAGSGGLTSPQVGLVFTPLRAPENLATTVISPTQISLSWTDPNDDSTACSVWRRSMTSDWTRIGVVGAHVTSYTDSGLSANTRYGYEVRAINNLGPSNWSFEQDAQIVIPPPAAPSSLAGSAFSSTQINLTWADNSNNETAFTVWRRVGTGAWSRIAVLGPNATAYSDTGLSPSTAYAYRVRAANSGAASAWSNDLTVTTSP